MMARFLDLQPTDHRTFGVDSSGCLYCPKHHWFVIKIYNTPFGQANYMFIGGMN